jgi:hypothetical protein
MKPAQIPNRNRISNPDVKRRYFQWSINKTITANIQRGHKLLKKVLTEMDNAVAH